MRTTPLEAWIQRKIKCHQLTREDISRYQICQLNKTLKYALEHSVFYKKELSLNAINIKKLEDIVNLPFTTAENIMENPLNFLCVSQSDIQRIVSLDTSGTTGRNKRIFFTSEDQELTIDFFNVGMSTLVGTGDRVLVMLPGERPGSVGDLLLKSLDREGAVGIYHGPIKNLQATLETLFRERVNSIVGIPSQILALARYSEYLKPPKIKNVLLSTDYVPNSIKKELERIWGAKAYNHYGMTEMGFGGGVECSALSGYHLREADLYFEIINSRTGAPVSPGEFGEVVFTTLTRSGMPLIRYRTGDLARFIPEPCPCGSILKRMDTAKGRLANCVELAIGEKLTMLELDEKMFAVKGVLDFNAFVTSAGNRDNLHIEAKIIVMENKVKEDIKRLLLTIPVIKAAVIENSLDITVSIKAMTQWQGNANKRMLKDLRFKGEEKNEQYI